MDKLWLFSFMKIYHCTYFAVKKHWIIVTNTYKHLIPFIQIDSFQLQVLPFHSKMKELTCITERKVLSCKAHFLGR